MSLNNNGTTRKMSQRYFCPAEYTTKAKPKNLTQNLVSFFRFLGLGLGLVLGFVLVVYSAGQKYRWLIFLVVPVSALLSSTTSLNW